MPAEIEEILYKHKNIHECVVTSRQDEIMGEEIVAIVVPKKRFDDKQLIEELRNLCKSELSSYKVPAAIYIWDQLPKTYSNKILRRKVHEVISSTQLEPTL